MHMRVTYATRSISKSERKREREREVEPMVRGRPIRTSACVICEQHHEQHQAETRARVTRSCVRVRICVQPEQYDVFGVCVFNIARSHGGGLSAAICARCVHVFVAIA